MGFRDQFILYSDNIGFCSTKLRLMFEWQGDDVFVNNLFLLQ
jgi:hypothetical protein